MVDIVVHSKEFMKEKFGYRKALEISTACKTHKNLMKKVIENNNIRIIFDSGSAKGNNFTYFFVKQVSNRNGMVYSTEIHKKSCDIRRFLYTEGGFKEYGKYIQLIDRPSMEVLNQLVNEPIEFFFLDTSPDIFDEFEYVINNWKNPHIFTHDWDAGKCVRIRKKYGKLVTKSLSEYHGLAYFKIKN